MGAHLRSRAFNVHVWPVETDGVNPLSVNRRMPLPRSMQHKRSWWRMVLTMLTWRMQKWLIVFAVAASL